MSAGRSESYSAKDTYNNTFYRTPTSAGDSYKFTYGHNESESKLGKYADMKDPTANILFFVRKNQSESFLYAGMLKPIANFLSAQAQGNKVRYSFELSTPTASISASMQKALEEIFD